MSKISLYLVMDEKLFFLNVSQRPSFDGARKSPIVVLFSTVSLNSESVNRVDGSTAICIPQALNHFTKVSLNADEELIGTLPHLISNLYSSIGSFGYTSACCGF